MEDALNNIIPLFEEDYSPVVAPYEIKKPDIPSGSDYYFTTDSGLLYEVLFAKKKDNYLENIINFSVLNEEFDDEYSETNRGELYRVISTVTEIVRLYHEAHGYSLSYEFSGEFKDKNKGRETSIRTLLYLRKARALMNSRWDIRHEGNKVVVYRIKAYHD